MGDASGESAIGPGDVSEGGAGGESAIVGAGGDWAAENAANESNKDSNSMARKAAMNLKMKTSLLSRAGDGEWGS